MLYYRLVKETDTTLRVSPKGMEVPGTECVFVEFTNETWMEQLVTFEDGRQVLCYLGISLSPPSAKDQTAFALHKIYDKDVKKCKNTYKT